MVDVTHHNYIKQRDCAKPLHLRNILEMLNRERGQDVARDEAAEIEAEGECAVGLEIMFRLLGRETNLVETPLVEKIVLCRVLLDGLRAAPARYRQRRGHAPANIRLLHLGCARRGPNHIATGLLGLDQLIWWSVTEMPFDLWLIVLAPGLWFLAAATPSKVVKFLR
jgi:hypothetical protein